MILSPYFMEHQSNDSYEAFVASIVKPGQDIINDLTPAKANLWHLSSALQGEAGELFDNIKKHAVYGKALDLENIVEELGDIEFFLAGIRQELFLSREKIIANNHQKLMKRYPNGYSNASAIARKDKE